MQLHGERFREKLNVYYSLFHPFTSKIRAQI